MAKSKGNEKAKVNYSRIYSDILTNKHKDEEKTIPRNNQHIMVDEMAIHKALIFMTQKWYVEANMCSIWEKMITEQACECVLTRKCCREQRTTCPKQSRSMEVKHRVWIHGQGHTHLEVLGFTTIAAKALTMMHHAKLNQELFLLLCKEAFQTMTKLDHLIESRLMEEWIKDMNILVQKSRIQEGASNIWWNGHCQDW